MEMGMMVQGLTPGMQDREKPDLSASVLGITRNRLERHGNGLKQQTVHHARILQGEGTERCRQGKNHVAVGDVQEVPLARSEPSSLGTALTLGAVPIATRVIADLLTFPRI
jgi:hypothetical protein